MLKTLRWLHGEKYEIYMICRKKEASAFTSSNMYLQTKVNTNFQWVSVCICFS